MRGMIRHVVGCALAATLFAAPAFAQQNTGTITGTVKDQSGAVLPGVTVTVKHVQTGTSTDFITNASGLYTAPELQPGEYEITFALNGFQPQTVRGVQLHVADRVEIDGRLGVGGVNENVQVSAASQFVQPSPQVQTLMGPTQVQELPLNNRNFVQLATLVPGVSSDLSDEVGIGLTSTVSISVNGGRRNAVNWMVDGVQDVDVGSNITLLNTPTLESIQEFKVITSSYAAEWPRSGGGVINVVTRGGTQKFEGTAYEFFRNDVLNANSFFRNMSSDPGTRSHAPRLRYNNPGFTVGGPLLPSRQKAYFFFSEEVRRISRAVSDSTINVIDPAWLNDPTNPNYVPPAQRDPNAVKLLSLWPAANLGSAQYINSVPTINNTRQEVVRTDVDLTPRWKLTGRYTHDLSQTVEPGGLFQSATAFLPHVEATHTNVPGQIGAVELRGSWGKLLNQAIYQFSSNQIHTNDDPADVNTRSALKVNIPELFPENAADRLPSVAISGIQGIGTIQVFNIQYLDNSITDNVTYQHGNHAYKAGAIVTIESKNENANNNTQGAFSFVAGGGRTAFQNFLTGNGDGLCGAGCTYSESQFDVTEHLRWKRYEMFAQDTWQIRPTITFDYGVRYGLYPGIVDLHNVLSTFDPALYNPANAPKCANASCSAVIPGTGNPLNGLIVAGTSSDPFGRAIYPTEKTDIQPRLGLAWDPRGDGKSIVRTGYGLYYDEALVGIFEQNSFTNPPYVATVTLQDASLSNPTGGTPPGTKGLQSLIASSVPFKTPRMQQWNVGYQRQLYRRGSIDVGYVGSHGDHQIQPVDINRPNPATVVALGSATLAAPFPGYAVATSVTGAGIQMRQTTAYSNYWGILTQFRHEGGRAGTYTLNYTLSPDRTTATNDRDSADFPQNPNDLKAEYADARTDRRHIFNATYVIELPFYRNAPALLKAALFGWQLAGYTTIQSGPPVSRIIELTNNDRRGLFADQVGDPRAGQMAFPYWFDPNAFVPATDGTYGTSKRAAFRLPGRDQTDLALSKNFYPMSRRVQFRADFINAFNHTQWVGVDNACQSSLTTCDASTFGQITSTRNPREVQLSLKFYW